MSVVMPDLVSPRRLLRHTLDSALPALARLGVPAERVVVESAGPGWRAGTVVRQSPAPGVPLAPQTRVVLAVAGTGCLESLPYPLRDASDDALGVERLMALFDSPLQKLGHHLRGAGGYLALQPGDAEAARRWIEEVFQVDAGPWPRTVWYALARLLAALPRVAGREEAVRLALHTVCGLPLARLRLVRRQVPLPPARQIRLGSVNSCLGVDTQLGQGLLAEAAVEVTIGPIGLETYLQQLGEVERRQREALYHLVLPCPLQTEVRERWEVGDRSRGARLGAGQALVLGVNAYLGSPEIRPQRSPA